MDGLKGGLARIQNTVKSFSEAIDAVLLSSNVDGLSGYISGYATTQQLTNNTNDKQNTSHSTESLTLRLSDRTCCKGILKFSFDLTKC